MKLPRPLIALLAVAIMAASGCTTSGNKTPKGEKPVVMPSGTTIVAAPDALTDPLTAVAKEFETAYPTAKIALKFGDSAKLADEAVGDKPPDVFIAGDPATMKRVTDADAVAGTPKVLLRNWIVIAVTHANPAKISSLTDLAKPGVRVAQCAANTPCGAATKRTLDAAGVTLAAPVIEPDVKGALAKVTAGAADAALVYRTDARAAERDVHGIEMPSADKSGDDYPIAVTKKTANPSGSDAFLGFVSSALARKIFLDAGWEAL